MKKIIFLSVCLLIYTVFTVLYWNKSTTDVRSWMLILGWEAILQIIIELYFINNKKANIKTENV